MKLNKMSEEQFKKYQLKKLEKLFEKASSELYKLSDKTRDDFLNYHNEGYTLEHCIRWGLTACKELNEEVE